MNDTGTYTCTTPKEKSHKVKILVKDVRCPQIEITEGLKASDLGVNGLNAQVYFECTNGNSLIGVSTVKCLPSGRWDNPIPACQNIVCPDNITSLATTIRANLKVINNGWTLSYHIC